MAWKRTEQDEVEADILKRYGNIARTWGMAIKRVRITDSELAPYWTGFQAGIRCAMHAMAKDLRMSDDELAALEAAAERMADLCQIKETTPDAATPGVTADALPSRLAAWLDARSRIVKAEAALDEARLKVDDVKLRRFHPLLQIRNLAIRGLKLCKRLH